MPLQFVTIIRWPIGLDCKRSCVTFPHRFLFLLFEMTRKLRLKQIKVGWFAICKWPRCYCLFPSHSGALGTLPSRRVFYSSRYSGLNMYNYPERFGYAAHEHLPLTAKQRFHCKICRNIHRIAVVAGFFLLSQPKTSDGSIYPFTSVSLPPSPPPPPRDGWRISAWPNVQLCRLW